MKQSTKKLAFSNVHVEIDLYILGVQFEDRVPLGNPTTLKLCPPKHTAKPTKDPAIDVQQAIQKVLKENEKLNNGKERWSGYMR